MKRVKKKAGARVAPKPNQKLVRGVARALKKRGVTVDASGRARKDGRVINADRLRRAVAAVKRALAPAPKKKTTKATVAAKRPASKVKAPPTRVLSRAMAKTKKKPTTRAVAPPTRVLSREMAKTKKPAPKPTKKPSRAIAKVPPRGVAKTKKPTKKIAPRRPSAAQQRAVAQLARARAERSRLAAQVRAQDERQKKLEAEQRRLRREATAMKKQLAALTQQEKRAERVVERVAAEEEEEIAVPPEAPTVPVLPTAPPAEKAMTDEERLFAEQRAEQEERERLKPRPATPFEILLKPYVDAGKMPTAEELRELQLAAAAMGAPPSIEASDADFAIASAYENISAKEQRAWARALNPDGSPRLSEAARQIIREHAIDRAIKNRSPKALVDMRASPLFNDDAAVREMMRTLGPLEDRISISYEEARRLIVEHLKTKEKWGTYRDEINKYLGTLRPTSDQIQEAIKFAKNDIERQQILDHLIPELARKYGLDERELWAMAKSPSAVAVVI